MLLLEEGALRLGQGQCLRRQRIEVGRFWGLDIGVQVLSGQPDSMVQREALLPGHRDSPLREVGKAALTVRLEPKRSLCP